MSFFRLTDKTAGTKPAEEAGSTGFRRAVRIIRTVLICFAAALYVFYFITNLRAMSIGGGILSASLLALFTFAAYKAVPLVLKTLIEKENVKCEIEMIICHFYFCYKC